LQGRFRPRRPKGLVRILTAVESETHKAKIDALTAQIEAIRLKCDSIAKVIEAASSPWEKSALTGSLERALQQKHTLQLALVLVERNGRGNKGSPSKPNCEMRVPGAAPDPAPTD